MKRILNYKDKVIWTLLIVVIISGLGIYGNRLFFDNIKGKSFTKVSFNFEGVDEGLNPQGGVFDAQLIKSNTVLQKALSSLGWDENKIDVQTLASHMMVKGIVPTDAMNRIMPSISGKDNMQFNRVGGLTYHPTQYEISLAISRDMNLTTKEANQLLDAIVESFTEYFVEKYKDTQAIDVAITKIDHEAYDYSEYINLVTGQLEIIKSYMQSKEQASKDFKSPTTHLSFGDLIAQIELIQNVEIGNVQALLDSFVITKNSKESAVVYSNMVQRMSRESDKYRQEAQMLKNIANSYQKDRQVVLGSGTLVLDTVLDQDKELDEDEEPLYDTLVKQAAEIENKANRLSRQVKYYEGLVANLKAQNENGTSQKVEPYIEEVGQGIVYISNQIDKMMEDIKTTVNDYYEQEVFEGSIIPVMTPKYVSSFRSHLIKDTMILAGITFLMILLGLIYLLGKKSVRE